MILLDYSQIAISNIIVQKLQDENMIRHCILNSIRMYNKKYRAEYGQMVICVDGFNTWRKEYFPQYKAHRKKNRSESDLDWTEIFRVLNLVREEIQQNLPYKVLHLEGCEADDCIAAMALRTQDFGQDEPVMIISSDKDFIQLQKFKNVKQFSPIQKKMVTDKNPRLYLMNHILKGDSGDGIPNVKADDNCLVESRRQPPITAKFIDQVLSADWPEDCTAFTEEIKRNYHRNKKLIDLTEIPPDVIENIIYSYDNQKVAPKMKVLNYLIKKRCNQLIDCVEEFYNA